MRLDVFLKESRLVKRRTVAKELCDDGVVSVNGRTARPGREVAVGDRLSLRLWNRLLEVEIECLPERPLSTAESRALYRVVSEKRIEP